MKTEELLTYLKACTNSKLLDQGKLLHQKILSLGLQCSLPFTKSLLNLYISCHSYNSAVLIFRTAKDPSNIFLWNRLISSYAKNFMFAEALNLFHKLLNFPSLKPNSFTYPSVLTACGGFHDAQLGKSLHTSVIKTGFISDVVVASSVVVMYARCGVFYHAIKVFDEMPERDVPSWNAVISCYYQAGQWDKALKVFDKMEGLGIEPNSVTLTTALCSCARLCNLERGREIHEGLTWNGIFLNGYVSAALVEMYGKCGHVEMAREVFEQITRKGEVAWNSMIAGYGLKGDIKSCVELFHRMIKEGSNSNLTLATLSNLIVACSRSAELKIGKFIHGFMIRNKINTDIYIENSLADLYMKCGSVRSAEFIFERLPKMEAASWNIMISGYVISGRYSEALKMFCDMRDIGLEPDAITFSSVLPACSHLTALEQGKKIHKCIMGSEIESNKVVMSAILDMYAKCGAIEDALGVFNQLPERDLVSWTSMISAYGSHGRASEALNFFQYMQQSGTNPDEVAFLSVMSACSHGGLVKEGCYLFNLMISGYGLKPTIEHYSCLIDILGRAGRLHEAYSIIQSTKDTRRDIGLLCTLANACYLCGELELGEEISRLLIDMHPDDSSAYIILSNLYASAKKWDDVQNVRVMMKELRLKKEPGCSWIEVDNWIQPFLVENLPPQLAEMVYDCLAILTHHMEKDHFLPC